MKLVYGAVVYLRIPDGLWAVNVPESYRLFLYYELVQVCTKYTKTNGSHEKTSSARKA